jgi:predicted TIM-barrel fold metal-dependent hydrolase
MDGLSIDLPVPRSFEQRSITAFIDEMDEGGVDLAVVMARHAPRYDGIVSNDDVAELTHRYPKRFVGFGAVDVTNVSTARREIERCQSLGLRGVAFDNPWSDPALYDDDASLFPLYERCADLNLLVSLTSSLYLGPDITYSMPSHIQIIASRIPALKIIVPHAAWPWVLPMCGVALRFTNIYLLPDFYGYLPNMPGAEHYMQAANSYLSYRLLYGSSYPVRPLTMSLKQFRGLPFASDAIRSRCMGGNAARLLGIAD